MSAYLELTADDLESVRLAAGASALRSCRPITAGIENSNWFLVLEHDGRTHEYVLTRVEAVAAEELPFFIALTDALAEADLPVPMALRLAGGRRQFMLHGKPALLVPRLPGTHVETPDAAQCRAAGAMLARLHDAAQRCALRRDQPDHRWWPTAFAYVAPRLPRDAHDELAAALLAGSRTFAACHLLPHGIVHGDLFRDNVLVQHDEVTGLLDFFHATHDLLAWDLAIALNDWAVIDGIPQPALAQAFTAGYETVRTLSAAERAALPALRRAAAARFWLSRLVAAEKQAGAEGAIQRKDPEGMRALLRALAG